MSQKIEKKKLTNWLPKGWKKLPEYEQNLAWKRRHPPFQRIEVVLVERERTFIPSGNAHQRRIARRAEDRERKAFLARYDLP